MLNLFKSELSGLELQCGTAVVAAGSGRCKNPNCGRRSPSMLEGYCSTCAVSRGINPLKACGCKPIILNEAALASASDCSV